MIEVRIRKESEPTHQAVKLCTLSTDDIQDLLDSILEWGLFFDGGDGGDVSISCNYVYYNAEAYFEIIISEHSSGESSSDESEPND